AEDAIGADLVSRARSYEDARFTVIGDPVAAVGSEPNAVIRSIHDSDAVLSIAHRRIETGDPDLISEDRVPVGARVRDEDAFGSIARDGVGHDVVDGRGIDLDPAQAVRERHRAVQVRPDQVVLDAVPSGATRTDLDARGRIPRDEILSI